MEIDKSIRSGVKKADDYISLLEDELLKKETSSIIKFIISAYKVASALAEDMVLMLEDDIASCKILKDDKDSKLLDRLLNLLKNVDTFDQISKIADALTPQEIDQAKKDKPHLTVKDNPFETVMKQVKEKNGQK